MIRHTPANAAQVALIDQLKTTATAFEAEILAKIGNSRERALALTNLEQASMWATAAIVEDPKHRTVQA